MTKDATLYRACGWLLLGMLVCILLAGCTSYGKPEATHINLHVNYMTHDEFTILKTRMGVNPFYDAFAKWYDDEDGRHCYIFMPKPSTAVGTFILGHELLHCTDGDFH